MSTVTENIGAFARIVSDMDRVAVAVSGGVDSLTLATLVHDQIADRAEMFHAVSPAVPPDATERVRALADRQGWVLSVIDAGEFGDADYRVNPVNRCFYCKTSLYGAIVPLTDAQVVSGTNVDDLGEYRPGLEAARIHSVRHPFVEAGIDKSSVRLIARQFGLGYISELPAAPCLSSRIETGIGIDPAMLKLVDKTEKMVGLALRPHTVRCRVRAKGVVVELDESSLSAAGPDERQELSDRIAELFSDGGFDYRVSFAPYRVGSAFVHPIRIMSE